MIINNSGQAQKLFSRKAISVLAILILAVLGVGGCENKSKVANNNEVEKEIAAASHSSPKAELNVELWPALNSPNIGPDGLENEVDGILARMSVEEKVGQVLQAEIQWITPEEVKQYHIGSILNGGGSFPNRNPQAKPKDWVALADKYYDASMDSSDGGVAIPIFWGTDAVHGNGNSFGATLFPHNIGLGAANNPELIKKIGEVTAKEVRVLGLDWAFSPTIAVAQNDRWGRTYESYAERPEIVASYAKAMVEGLQGVVGEANFLDGSHVIATAKHYLGDGGTFGGDDQGNARVSEQELVDIHNAGYVSAINAGVQTVMASFSSWNGEKMHANKYLMTDVLKQRMGFDGLVVGDWNGHGQVPGCTNSSCPQSINAGLDLYMVTYDWKDMYANLLKQVEAGVVTSSRLDDAVRRILRVKLRAGLFDQRPSERMHAGDASQLASPEHRAIARQAVRESLVLLKNKNNILPITAAMHVLVVGDGADNIGKQCGGWSINWQGVSKANENFPQGTSIFSGIQKAVAEAGGKAVLSVDGEFKSKPDIAVVVYGEEPYAEGIGDVNTLEFEPGSKKSLALLKKLREAGIPTVSVFISGRPLWVNPELNASDAFVAAWLPGTEGAGVADLLVAQKDGTPRYDFRGKLSFSWPKLPLQEQLNPQNQNYDPLFAFGYGLTYSGQDTGPGQLAETVEGVVQPGANNINLYMGRALQPWNVYISKEDRRQQLSGAYASLLSRDVKVETIDKDVQEDALRFSWHDTWNAGLGFEDGPPMDLSGLVDAKGLLAFDLNLVAYTKTDLKVLIKCGDNCERTVSLDDYAKVNVGKGWQRIIMPLSCFVQEKDDFSAVTLPFSLQAGGVGELLIANIQFLLDGEPNFTCPDYRKLSTTPEMLNEYWAVDWWQPRHQEKLAEVKQGKVDLLFIGDSITQGWENEGKKVWQAHYGDRNAVNLGFGGDRTENVLWRIQNGEVAGISPKVAVLMIGTNNTGHRKEAPEIIAAGIKKILWELRQRLPETKILMLAIFPRSASADDTLRQINEKTNKIISGFADDENVYFLNINDKFLAQGGKLSTEIMPDLLHLSEAGYSIWAEAMEPTLTRLMGN